MTRHVRTNPRSASFLAGPDGHAGIVEPHLDEITLRSLARGGLSEERADIADSHLEHCGDCRRQFLRFASAESENEESIEPEPDGVPPAVTILGWPESGLRGLSAATGLPVPDLEALAQELRARQSPAMQELLLQAEVLADSLTFGRYSQLKQRLAQRPTPLFRADVSKAVGWGAPAKDLEYSTAPTEGTYKDDSRFELILRSGGDERDYHTRIICTCTEPIDFSWGFRITYSPDDEVDWLMERGLTRNHLGALRLAGGEEYWGSIVDVLVPTRFGQADDVVFDRAIVGPLRERLPGAPRSVRFWVDPK
jgi:hypothetical protein